jgi:hypothetical protein
VTVLIAGDSAAGGDLDSAAATVAGEHEVRRAGTIDAVREALPECSAVVVADLPSTAPAAVRETVESGVYCPPTTPVVRLLPPGERLDLDGEMAAYDGLVPADRPAELLDVLRAIEQTDSYREAVEDLYEACRANARGDPVEAAEMAAAFEWADRAFEDLQEASEWTPYERVFVDVEADEADTDDDS